MVKSVNIPVKITPNNQQKNPFAGIEDFVDKLEGNIKKIFSIELKKRLLDGSIHAQYASEVMSILLEMQATYFSGAVGQEDPTRLFKSENMAAVASEISTNFRNAAASVAEGTTSVSITLLSDDFLGIGKEGDKKGTAPIQWLAYFLSGSLESDLYWINTETFEMITGEVKNLGRFGVGCMWQIEPDRKEGIARKLSSFGISLDSLKHPQSGKPGKDWFDSVWKNLDFYEVIYAPALEATFLRVKEMFIKEKVA